MKVYNHIFKNIDELKNFVLPPITDKKKTLIQVFSGFVEESDIKQIQDILNQYDIDFIGVTTAGEISNSKSSFNTIVLSIVEFEKTNIEYGIFENKDDYQLGIDIAKTMFKDDTKAAILFLSGLMSNGEDTLYGIASINNEVTISGGMAGDNGNFKASFVFNNDTIYNGGGVIAVLNSEVLNVFNDYELNWQPIGKEMHVTKAEKNHLYEIDNIVVRDLYEIYLGERIAKGLPLSASEFPIIKKQDDVEICRAFPHMFEDGSMLTIGNTYVGDKVQFSFGNVELILNQTKENIQNQIPFQPDIVFNYSCAGRLAFLQSKIDVELEVFKDIAPTAGFFTYGEILHKNNKHYLLNYSFTFLGLSEEHRPFKKTQQITPQERKNFFEDKYILVLDALTHLSNRVIQELNESKKQIETLHKHTEEAIRYASLIQRALLSEEAEMSKIFHDKFVFWLPKDIVGGDIWGFDILRNEDEALLMIVDCTGHGVPGAFVTMIVKSIEREIVAKLKKHPEYDISPSKIMSYFNKMMKKLLNQQDKNSVSNAGFDGGIIYYNKKQKIIKYTGAETPLFYVDNSKKLHMIKGDRYSVGYKNCDENYKYSEHILEVEKGMKFYLTTDGYLDQNGGEKGFPFGKKRFKKIIEQYNSLPMNEQRDKFIEAFLEYKQKEEQNDDITVIGIEI